MYISIFLWVVMLDRTIRDDTLMKDTQEGEGPRESEQSERLGWVQTV